MAHRFTAEELSDRMRLIRSKDTKAELIVRRLLHGAGYRYRIHDKTLPGKPDLVFPARKKVIFVHGCFWHQHELITCKAGKRPISNTGYWYPKLARNVERDQQQIEQLNADGWDVFVIWECELGDQRRLIGRLTNFLGAPQHIRRRLATENKHSRK